MDYNLKGNLWKYALLLIANKRVFIAILGAYYLTIPGVTPWWIGTLMLIGSISGFVIEIPSGYVSDKLGHKKALIVSRVAMLLSTLFFLLADSVWLLIFGSVFLSISNAFHSGTGSAFMHETLRGLGREEDYTKVMGKISSIGFAVPIVLMVSVPFLVTISYKMPFVVSLFIDLIGIYAAISLVNPKVSKEYIKEVNLTNFRQVAREGYNFKFFRHAFFSGIVGGVLIGVGGFRAPYQMFLDIPVVWFGVLFGMGRALASILLAYSGKIKTLIGDHLSFYKLEILIFSILFISLGLFSTWWVIALIFMLINGLHWGLSRVSEGHTLEIIKTSKFKATLLSMKAQIRELVTAFAGFTLGFLIEYYSYQGAFFVIGLIFLFSTTAIYMFIARNKH